MTPRKSPKSPNSAPKGPYGRGRAGQGRGQGPGDRHRGIMCPLHGSRRPMVTKIFKIFHILTNFGPSKILENFDILGSECTVCRGGVQIV